MTTVGVISDTHGLMRPEALEALRGSALIIHAGDVGPREVLNALGEIAPVRAVRGNVDTLRLPATRVVKVESARIFLLHNIAELDFDPAARGVAAVVYGHSHKAKQEVRGGVLYLNPGAAGPRRFRLPVTVARMTVEGARVSAEIVQLGC